jgi:prolyl oligopeptidase
LLLTPEEVALNRALALIALLLIAAPVWADDQPDPFLWLEEVLGERPLEWVKEQNARSTTVLEAVPEYAALHDRILEILDSKDRIPMPKTIGEWIFNKWQDEKNPRGLLRRTTVESYASSDPEWETVLDLDALSAAEETPWVYKAMTCLAPEYRRCMFALSRGGSDATVKREFDLVERHFVEDGFRLPEAKSEVAWKDADTLWVATDFGGGTLTESGYPRIVKAWKRGTPLAEARQLFATAPEDVGVWPWTIYTTEGSYTLLTRSHDFFSGDQFLSVGDRLVRLDLPLDVAFQAIFRDQVLLSLRNDWTIGETTYAQGALLALGLDDLLRGAPAPKVLFEPSGRVSLDEVATTRERVVFSTLDNVRSRLYRVEPADGEWRSEEVALPGLGTASIEAASDDYDRFFVLYEDFLTPDTLYLVEGSEAPQAVKSLPALFDASGLEVAQHEATSKDGTRIPYFLVSREGFERDGSAPTMLYAYGGFEVSKTSTYSSTLGSSWLERGGVYVLANIRGGGEFGPAWHQAAVRENHFRNFEDLIAVAEDLVARKITSPEHLGIIGGSQGGLLVGATLVLRPDLFNAVVSQVPLLDMKRYHLLLAGASWMSEYGDPDNPDDWTFMKQWSPYQLVRKDAEYPEPFFWTTTRDDRVHPGHARKMVARMKSQGHPVLYFENIEGGHGSGSVNAQRARTYALQYAYLWKKLR